MIFFVLVHVPLMKLTVFWSLLTASLIWFIDHKTKRAVYEKLQLFAQLISCTKQKVKTDDTELKAFNFERDAS